jgi:hypothetical protein
LRDGQGIEIRGVNGEVKDNQRKKENKNKVTSRLKNERKGM